MELTEDQWNIVSTILPKDRVRPDRRSRVMSDPRQVVNAALWILRTGAPWQGVPDRNSLCIGASGTGSALE